jgi:hypothetical protein
MHRANRARVENAITNCRLAQVQEQAAAAPKTTEIEIVTSTQRFAVRDIPPAAAKTLREFAAQALNHDGVPVFTLRPVG